MIPTAELDALIAALDQLRTRQNARSIGLTVTEDGRAILHLSQRVEFAPGRFVTRPKTMVRSVRPT